MAGAKRRPKPNWELDEAVKAAKKTIKALDKYGEDLQPRLPAGITDGLAADLAVLTGAKISRPVAAKKAGAKTKGERALAKDGAELLSALRDSLKTCPVSTPEVLKAVGVGSQVIPSKTTSVAAALTAMLDASKAYTDVFRAAGILDGDLAEAKAILGAVLKADETQQETQQSARELTAAKDAAQIRIEKNVAIVAAVGRMQFRKVAAKRAVFEKLTPGAPRKKAKAGV